MSVLTIRKHQRFAVRHRVTLQGDDKRRLSGLLVELSLEGCRLAVPGFDAYRCEQVVQVRIAGFGAMRGAVRWAKDGFVGLRFVAALHTCELHDLIQTCRPETAQAA